MARLYRPHIPLSVRCHVACRQLGIPYLQVTTYGDWLRQMLRDLADRLGCAESDLRLDHDPALGARAKSVWSTDGKVHYIPEANDPNFLKYRPHGPQFEGSHLIKTNVRGDHGQHPDRVLIKKQRRIERGPKPKRGPKIQSRGFGPGRKFEQRRKP